MRKLLQALGNIHWLSPPMIGKALPYSRKYGKHWSHPCEEPDEWVAYLYVPLIWGSLATWWDV